MKYRVGDIVRISKKSSEFNNPKNTDGKVTSIYYQMKCIRVKWDNGEDNINTERCLKLRRRR